jgi:hypothetical protein
MAKGKESWLVKCRVEPGMFKDEWLAYVDAINPTNERQSAKVQLFVDAREVRDVRGTPKRNEPAPAWLRVTMLAVRGDVANVLLPQPATPFGESILVRGESVRETPVS